MPVGFEGMHIWDISNLADPELVGEVELSARPQADAPGCGTHTLTLVPDLEDGRVLIYNQTSGGNAALPPGLQECNWLDVIQVPLGTRAPPASCTASRSRADTRRTTRASSSGTRTCWPWPRGICPTCSASGLRGAARRSEAGKPVWDWQPPAEDEAFVAKVAAWPKNSCARPTRSAASRPAPRPCAKPTRARWSR